jgi:NAD-dependent SIR2 family protein deacetylase
MRSGFGARDMKEMLLLGAGASVEADVPDTYGMTRRIAEHFRKEPGLGRHGHVISFAIGGLLFQQGIRGDAPLEGRVNVEELFNAVQLLAERNTLEAAPFVGSWHAMVQEFDKAPSAPPQLDRLYRLIYEGVTKEILNALPSHPPAFIDRDIDRDLEQTIERKVQSMVKGHGGSYSCTSVGRRIGDYVMRITKDWMDRLKATSPHGGYDFQREFRNAIEQMRDRPGEGEIFSETAELMIRTLANIVWIDQAERVRHLKPIISLAETQKQLTVATLNYDNGIELLATSGGFPCATGIEEWSKSGSFVPSDGGIFLLKLHGSIDWALVRNQRSRERPMPHSIIQQAPLTRVREAGFRPAVIFGQRNKLTVEAPFLDLLRAFQKELSQSDTLTVVGYSFRDTHVNEYITQWLNQSEQHKLRIVNLSFDRNTSEFAQELVDFCGTRVEIVREPAGKGLARLYPVPNPAPVNAVVTETLPKTSSPEQDGQA